MVHEQPVTTVPIRPEARVRPLVERRVPCSHLVAEEAVLGGGFVVQVETLGVHARGAADEGVAVLRRAETGPTVERSRRRYFNRWPL